MTEIRLSEKFLLDAGGWQAMKHARAIMGLGRVVSSAWEPPVLRGLVRDGEIEYRAGLKISSSSDIENLCGCPESRREGRICPHSLAVGLRWLARMEVRTEPEQREARSAIASGPALPAADPLAPFRGATPGARTARLHLVLPPNWRQQVARGVVPAGIEIVWGKGDRCMLSAAIGQFALSDADQQFLEVAFRIAGNRLPGALQLDADGLGQIFSASRGHDRISLGRKVDLKIAEEAVRPDLHVTNNEDGGLVLDVRDKPADLIYLGTRSWVVTASGAIAEVAPGLPAAYRALLEPGPPVTVPEDGVRSFLVSELQMLRKAFAIRGEMPESGVEPSSPKLLFQVLLNLEGSFNHLVAQLRLEAGGPVGVEDPTEPARRLIGAGFLRDGADDNVFVLKGQNGILNFLGRNYPMLQREWEVTLGPRLTNLAGQVEHVKPRLSIQGSGTDWLTLEVGYVSEDGQQISASEITSLIQRGQFHTRLRSGKMVVFDPHTASEIGDTLADCELTQTSPGAFRISGAHGGFLMESVRDLGDAVALSRSWENWKGGKLREPDAPKLGDLDDVLRAYQKEGVKWFRRLASNRLAGILADEMGLGKTIQALAFLRGGSGRALVVCPSSLLFNWRREAERFTPELAPVVLEGPDRLEMLNRAGDSRLLITSYALLRRDIDVLKRQPFQTVILDEAHHIKNPTTANAKSAGQLPAPERFVLTGTPVENSPRDLWSLMHFLMPGYLGSPERFAERFERPIALGGEEGAAASRRLARKIRPFLLRRLKSEVAPELPERLEQVAFCTLSGGQREAYAAIMSEARKKIDETSEEPGRARMTMLAALTRLRQVCCDLRLLGLGADGAGEERISWAASGKMDLFGELLMEALDGGHRVLVFSQFVTMLKLIEEDLQGKSIAYCYLDGESKDREEQVVRFQTQSEIPVFLISLRAGGVGLNLTGADTVIHFDPWWNPAVEAQATDRAHRIGQTRKVTAYKLIVRDTVEEKMLALQDKKRRMVGELLEGQGGAGLSLEEMRSLFDG